MKLKEARALIAEGVVIQFTIHRDFNPVSFTLGLLTTKGGYRQLHSFRGVVKRYATIEAVIKDIEAIQLCRVDTLYVSPDYNPDDIPF